MIYTAVEPSPGSYDDAYLAGIARTVATLGRHGIYSLLDFHQDMYNERFAGEGFPDWSVQDDGLPNTPNLGFPGNYVVDAGAPARLRPPLGELAGPGRRRARRPLRGGVAVTWRRASRTTRT